MILVHILLSFKIVSKQFSCPLLCFFFDSGILPYVCLSVSLSVGWSVGRSVGRFTISFVDIFILFRIFLFFCLFFSRSQLTILYPCTQILNSHCPYSKSPLQSPNQPSFLVQIVHNFADLLSMLTLFTTSMFTFLICFVLYVFSSTKKCTYLLALPLPLP